MAKANENTTHIVKTEFRDVNDFDTVHAVGDDVSHFPKDRLDKLVADGHVADVGAEKSAKKAAEEAKKAADDEAKRVAAEAKKADDEAKKQQAAEAKRIQDEAKRAEQEAKKKAEDEAKEAADAAAKAKADTDSQPQQ